MKNTNYFPSDFFAGNNNDKTSTKLSHRRNQSLSSQPTTHQGIELDPQAKKNVLKFLNARANSTPKFNNDFKEVTLQNKGPTPVKIKLVYSRSQNNSPKRLVIPRTNDNLGIQSRSTTPLKNEAPSGDIPTKVITVVPTNVVRVSSDLGGNLENYQTFAKDQQIPVSEATPIKDRPTEGASLLRIQSAMVIIFFTFLIY